MNKTSRLNWSATLLATALGLLGTTTTVNAEAEKLRVARQPGMSYLPLIVAESEKLVEKRAAEAGLTKLEVEWREVNGGPALNDALLSDSLDIASGGISSFAILWNKSGKQVKSLGALNSVALLLNTTKENVKKLSDFAPNDRIAIPAVKVTTQAIIIQMAAAKELGIKNFSKYDTLTVGMAPSDATIQMLSGKSEINAAFSGPPYQNLQLEDKRVHTVLNSEEVVGGPFTNNMLWARTKFFEANPKLAKAFCQAIEDADELIKKDPKKAAEIFGTKEKSKTSTDLVESLIRNGQVRYTTKPENVMKVVEFMKEVGLISTAPAKLDELFFPTVQTGAGGG